MLATAGALPLGPGWAYEFKWDGVRAIAAIAGGTAPAVRPQRRRDHRRVPGAGRRSGAAGHRARCSTARSSCSTTPAGRRSRRWPSGCTSGSRAGPPRSRPRMPVTYMIFDVLAAGRRRPDRRARTQRRRETLDTLGLAGDHWLAPADVRRRAGHPGRGRRVPLEGVMAKRLTSVYRPGHALADWVKVKIDQTARVRRRRLAPGRAYSGRAARRRAHARTVSPTAAGSVAASRRRPSGRCSRRCGRLVAERSPFAADVPRPEAKGATWVRPELVVEVRYGAADPGRPAAVSPVPADASGPDPGEVDAVDGRAAEQTGSSVHSRRAASWNCPTWTRCSTRRPGSPRAR